MFDRISLTIVIGEKKPYDVELYEYGKNQLSFGRYPDNDIVLDSAIASGRHGILTYEENRVWVTDTGSTNGVYINGQRVYEKTALMSGDSVTFESPAARQTQAGTALLMYGVIMLLNESYSVAEWSAYKLTDKPVYIGRDPSCQIILDQVNVSRFHASISYVGDGYAVYDNNSTNGVFINGARITGGQAMNDRDVIFIANAKLFYSRGTLYYSREQPSVGVDVMNATRVVASKGNKKTILDDVSFALKPREFVAIIGGSGAGKSTLMNGMCGFSRITKGQIFFENEDLYKNYDALKNLVGYVPQQDIVHKDLTLYRMLTYTARMRMPEDTTEEERSRRIAEVIEMVELTGKEDTLIKSLSGGQRKRASIAVELVSDPTVFFLDEPSSGLDPGTERNLMHTLKNMTKRNKTVVVITHMTLNIGLCDKLIILGYGGRLCFFGTPGEALEFFGVSDFVDIYDQINTRSEDWQAHFRNVREDFLRPAQPASAGLDTTASYKHNKNRHSAARQLGVLCARYLELTTADKKKLMILMLQAPLLGLLLALVSYATDLNGAVTVFKYSGEAKAMLFSLSCAAFWIGMLNSVQEVCKERDIFNRERLANLKLMPYLLSKLIILGALCLIQSLMLIIVVGLIIGFPASAGFGMPSLAGMYFTTFLTAFSAAVLGLAVSSVSPNPDRAMTIAPIVLMPQILFSGIAFQLTDFSAFLSGIFNCRWSVRAYCILADINGIPASADSTGTTFEDVIYTASLSNFLGAWGALILISLVCLAFSYGILMAGTND